MLDELIDKLFEFEAFKLALMPGCCSKLVPLHLIELGAKMMVGTQADELRHVGLGLECINGGWDSKDGYWEVDLDHLGGFC